MSSACSVSHCFMWTLREGVCRLLMCSLIVMLMVTVLIFVVEYHSVCVLAGLILVCVCVCVLRCLGLFKGIFHRSWGATAFLTIEWCYSQQSGQHISQLLFPLSGCIQTHLPFTSPLCLLNHCDATSWNLRLPNLWILQNTWMKIFKSMLLTKIV